MSEKRKRKDREAGLEDEIIGLVSGLGGFAVKLTALNWVGFPDLTVFLPKGRILFIELKKGDTYNPSKWQLKWQKRLTDLGFICIIGRDYLTIRKTLREIAHPEARKG